MICKHKFCRVFEKYNIRNAAHGKRIDRTSYKIILNINSIFYILLNRSYLASNKGTLDRTLLSIFVLNRIILILDAHVYLQLSAAKID